jgi:hypothetical protein
LVVGPRGLFRRGKIPAFRVGLLDTGPFSRFVAGLACETAVCSFCDSSSVCWLNVQFLRAGGGRLIMPLSWTYCRKCCLVSSVADSLPRSRFRLCTPKARTSSRANALRKAKRDRSQSWCSSKASHSQSFPRPMSRIFTTALRRGGNIVLLSRYRQLMKAVDCGESLAARDFASHPKD